MNQEASCEHKSTLFSARSHRLLLLTGLLLGFALRTVRLGGESLWYDETVSVVLARKQIPELIAHTAGDIHPPGYYLLLHAWQSITHPTLAHGLEFLFAWPSLWFGLLILALVYALGRRLFDRRVALIAVWIGALHPFHLWYSQEVRMYTLGAALGLLVLWCAIKAWDRAEQGRSPWFWLFGYAIWAALGLYVLYYFLFLLLALNLAALAVVLQPPPGRTIWGRASRLWPWLGAQGAVLLLWLPWLPVFLRQALDPPVPPWRVPWQSWGEVAHTLMEVLAAQMIGQTPPGGILWPYALAVLGLGLAGFVYAKNKGQASSAGLIAAHGLLPLGLIFGLSLLAAPLYHVRYAFTYAPPLLLLLAAGMAHLLERRAWLGRGLLALWLGVSGVAAAEFWQNPLYRADDHRGAVADLAAGWRPGDLILVNAGWAYTALESYWPTQLSGPAAALPPPLGALTRLGQPSGDGVAVVRTGSVDGSAALGWGMPESDFFAISQAETAAALADLAADHARIWHYRLYDTVSDPAGVVRAWLAAHGELLLDRPAPGRDFARLQLFQGEDVPPAAEAGAVGPGYPIQAGEALLLLDGHLPDRVAAGEILYVPTRWRGLPGLAEQPGDLSTSLRIYDQHGHLLAQQDGGFLPPTGRWLPGAEHTQTLALALPAALPPRDYTIRLRIYSQTDGQPLAVGASPGLGDEVDLGVVRVDLPARPVAESPVLARFDYIDLLHAQVARTQQGPADPVDVGLIWRPRPNAYQDTYLVRLTLVDSLGRVAAQTEDALGGWDYASGQWAPGIPVMEWKRLTAHPPLAPGVYTLTLAVSRAGDGHSIAARSGPWPRFGAPWIEVGRIILR